ncbi:hypothetical protein CEQ90_14190 [Lewinellaceae bacterium SD302]|nr:hypothetical protein CEQ90_14190 [Lewinellaceae bacterium SD302]
MRILSTASTCLLLLILASCAEAVEPEYRFREGFLLVDGRLSNLSENSYLDLKRAELVGRQYVLQDIMAQEVTLVSKGGETTSWDYDPERLRYYPPTGFNPVTGEEYFIRLTDEEGFTYESKPEVMPEVVEMSRLDVRFAQESYFSEELDRFVPAFELYIDFEEPAATQDFYRLNYSSWESVAICLSCYYGFFDIWVGECVPGGRGDDVPRFDYACNGGCWQLERYPDINLYSDEFSNGNSIEGLFAGQIDFDYSGRILMISELERISAAAYNYTKVLADQGINSNGLNATLPASLDGNVDPIIDGQGLSLGYFSVGASSEQRFILNRDTIDGFPLPFDNDINYDIPPFPQFPYEHPCEGPNRSPDRPEGWEF